MPEVTPSPLAAWESFSVILGSAAAVLTGLVFVAVTLAADERRYRSPEELESGIAAFSTPTVVHFCIVFLISAIINAPWRNLANAALLIGLTGGGGAVYTAAAGRRLRRLPAYQPVWEDWLWHVLVPVLVYVVLVGLAIALPHSPRRVLFGIGAVAVALLFLGLRNVWDVVTYIATTHVPRRDTPPGERRPGREEYPDARATTRARGAAALRRRRFRGADPEGGGAER